MGGRGRGQRAGGEGGEEEGEGGKRGREGERGIRVNDDVKRGTFVRLHSFILSCVHSCVSSLLPHDAWVFDRLHSFIHSCLHIPFTS